MTKTKTIVLSLAAAGLLASAPAHAGRGGSFAKIRGAAQHGGPDAIVAELERAENIPCTEECMTFVMGLLEHDSYYVRDGAAWWFARRAAQKLELEERSVALLATGSSIEVRNAADTLGRVGHPRDLAAMDDAMSRGIDADAKVSLLRAMGRIANLKASPTLQAAMSDGSAAVRREAVLSWAKLLKQADAAPVVALVSDSDLLVRRAAAEVVGRFRVAGARAALEQVLASDADAAARRNAAWALGRIGDEASRSVLETATSDASSLVRLTARAAIRQLR